MVTMIWPVRAWAHAHAIVAALSGTGGRWRSALRDLRDDGQRIHSRLIGLKALTFLLRSVTATNSRRSTCRRDCCA